jgi:hypothetical protein
MEKLKIILLLALAGCGGSFKATFVTTEGVKVNTAGHTVSKEEFSAYMEKTVADWQVALIHSGITCDLIPALNGLKVTFMAHPFEYKGKLYNGLTFVQTKDSQVGWLPDLARTALGHELGHFILYSCHQPYDEASLLEWTKKFHLPY